VPEFSIQMGAAHLREYLTQYDEEVELALMAYNAGSGNLNEWLADPNVHDRDDLLRLAWFGETREYLERVMLDQLVYRTLYGG
jgi:soluble lytic murein transglycosylase